MANVGRTTKKMKSRECAKWRDGEMKSEMANVMVRRGVANVMENEMANEPDRWRAEVRLTGEEKWTGMKINNLL